MPGLQEPAGINAMQAHEVPLNHWRHRTEFHAIPPEQDRLRCRRWSTPETRAATLSLRGLTGRIADLAEPSSQCINVSSHFPHQLRLFTEAPGACSRVLMLRTLPGTSFSF